MDKSSGFKQITKMVNQYDRDQDLMLVGMSSVRNNFDKMKPIFAELMAKEGEKEGDEQCWEERHGSAVCML